MSDVTQILHAIAEGDPHAAEQLLPLVYDELRKLAAQKLAHEKPGQTLQATALVHEAYLRLVGNQPAAQVLKLRFFGLRYGIGKEAPPQLRIWVDYGVQQYPYSPNEPRKEPRHGHHAGCVARTQAFSQAGGSE